MPMRTRPARREGTARTVTAVSTVGNPEAVYDQVLGNQSAVYMPTTDQTNLVEPALINAISANKPVTAGTYYDPGNGLVGSHAYTVIGYDSASDTFLLYNPWGCDQPSPLTFLTT